MAGFRNPQWEQFRDSYFTWFEMEKRRIVRTRTICPLFRVDEARPETRMMDLVAGRTDTRHYAFRRAVEVALRALYPC